MTKRKYFGTKKKSELSEFEKSSMDGYKRRFSLWHNKQIDALTFSINLLFTVSVAVSGFIIANQDEGIFLDKVLCNQFSLTRTVLFFLTLSATSGILGLLARLNDLRLTKNKVRTKQRIFQFSAESPKAGRGRTLRLKLVVDR